MQRAHSFLDAIRCRVGPRASASSTREGSGPWPWSPHRESAAMPKLRVLLLLHSLDRTGAPKVILDAFEQLGDSCDFRILSPCDGDLAGRCRKLGPLDLIDESCEQTLEMRSLTPKAAWRMLKKRMYFKRFISCMSQWSPDLIYVNSVSALPMARKLAVPPAPAILHVHELDYHLDWAAFEHRQLFLEWPKRYIAVSQVVHDSLCRRFDVASEKISLVHEFVREGDFRASPEVPPRTSPRPVVIGGAGSVTWRKGTTLWLLMARELAGMLGEDAVRFAWVGVTHRADQCTLRLEAKKLKVDHLIRFIESTPDPLPHFASFDVFALTSWEDPCPIVVLENMMLGKPVVCFSASGGAGEQLGGTGVLVDEFCPRTMARCMAELVADPVRMRSLGLAASAHVRAHFTDAIQVPKLLNIMRSTVGIST